MSAPNLNPSARTEIGVEHFGRRVITVMGGNTGVVIGSNILEAITADEADHLARLLLWAAEGVRRAERLQNRGETA